MVVVLVDKGMAVDSVPAYSRFRCGHLGLAYNEAAFRHFLELDCRRAKRSMRSLLLILVRARMRGGVRPALDGRNAEKVFHALGSCVREVDFAGWYRESAVAGAVVALNPGTTADVVQRLAGRVGRMLEAELGQERVARFRVRLVRLGGKAGH
jgi:hypothetical protein